MATRTITFQPTRLEVQPPPLNVEAITTVNQFTIVKIILTASITSSVFNNIPYGFITFIVTQNATGGWTFAWPSNVKGGMVIGTTASLSSVQSFVSDGTNLYAYTPGVINQ